MERTRERFRFDLGLAGLGRELSDEEKHQIEVEVAQVEATAGKISHASTGLKIEQLRRQIRGGNPWSSSWGPVLFGGYRGSTDLLGALNNAQRKSLALKTERVSRTAVNLTTGAAAEDSPTAAAAQAFTREVKVQAEALTKKTTPTLVVVAVGLGVVYLLGKYLEGRR